jgi:2-oxoglutarate dehydrogenase E1 component
VLWCQEEPKNMGAYGFVKRRIESVMKDTNMKQEKLLYVGRRAAASPATGVLDRHLANQKNILRLAVEADKEEILAMWSGVSLVKYQLPIE